MVLTLPPPSTMPTLKVVLGSCGTCSRAIWWIALPMAWMALGIPKAPQLCPPGPVNVTSRRVLPMPVMRTSSIPCPSTASTVSTCPCQVSSKARMPQRLPSPSSPTLAAKMTRPGGSGCRWRMAAATLSMAATATQLSPIPGPYKRCLVWRICKGVARGKTVSRCAATSVVGPGCQRSGSR